MKIEIELPEIEGFEYTGEFREPVRNDWAYCANTKEAFQFETIGSDTKWHILRKLKPPREFNVGAFYPVIYKDRERDIAEYYSNRNEFSTINYGICILDAFSWIGEEIKIEWGE